MKDFLKAINAGLLIGLSYMFSTILQDSVNSFLKNNVILGGLVFSFGLICILLMDLKLFTGIVGYGKIKDIPNMLKVFIGNFIGAAVIGYVFGKTNYLPIAWGGGGIVAKNEIFPLFLKAIFCGIIIYLCVESYRRNKKWIWITPVALTLMITTGLYHSIVAAIDFFPYLLSIKGKYFFPWFGSYLLCFLGNIIGGRLGKIMIGVMINNVENNT